METFDIGLFRTKFPEFSNVDVYPTSTIEAWAEIGCLLISCRVWKRAWFRGMALYIAHQITIEAQNVKLAANGGVPGTFGGVANSKAVGSASVGYDSASTSVEGAGFYNLTNYGKQFYQLVKVFGAGARQL